MERCLQGAMRPLASNLSERGVFVAAAAITDAPAELRACFEHRHHPVMSVLRVISKEYGFAVRVRPSIPRSESVWSSSVWKRNVLTIRVAAIQVAIRPRCCPGQMRMPVPNGMYAVRSALDRFCSRKRSGQ